MRLLDLTCETPEANLAADEALLEWITTSEPVQGGVLRLWNATRPFVVLGHANRAAAEVNLTACHGRGVPVLRRSTGGGTVYQDTGCLNYSLVVPVNSRPGLASVTGAHRTILEVHRAALSRLLNTRVEIAGTSDLTLRGRKFSGNAQRRTRDHLLYHGTFLLHADLGLMEELLPPPTRQPEYRNGRSHREFLCTLPVPADAIRAALRTAWAAHEPFDVPLDAAIARWTRDRYGRAEWNLKF